MKFFSQARSATSCTARSGEMLMTLTRARRIHPVVAARGPAMHHRVGHVGMKLEAEGMAGPECLHREIVALGEQFGATRQLKSLAMPVVDALRPVRAERMSGRGRTDRVVADLGAALRMRRDPARRAAWRASARRGKCRETAAARAAEFRSSRSPGERSRRGSLALIGPPKMTAPACSSSVSGRGSPKRGRLMSSRCPSARKRIADAARRRGFLVQDDQNRQQGCSAWRHAAAAFPGEGQHVTLAFVRPERHRLLLRYRPQAGSIPK